ncbi:type IV secretion system protein VirB1 [Rhodanobacter sp. ANJX3]|uniref:lytic transglycosylase domain-containing protein n=1 Tax=Rhodanobacter sp. ANJX3 TaxID=2723083 RepID=UPI00161E3FC0|nr:lytic transglycosylase domain-containing protein [Rhodanobacter sp. ANJX3]MBB5359132.1 type IV secretion system protein VirB1 [Rhodanobacter sp. ANJX3]
MLTGMELMSCPNQAVPAEVMHHIVHVESGYNPFAIGVVGGQLVRQPQSLDEAIATAQMLETKGYNYSLGVSQVNRSNLTKYGLDTYAKAFNPCLNLSAGSRILNECYYSSGGDWGKAFSCYYSGDFVTGFRQGYVQKVFASMSQNAQADSSAAPIPLKVGSPTAARPVSRADIVSGTHASIAQQDTAAYRISLRSTNLLDAVVAPLVGATVAAATGTPDAKVAAPEAPATSPASTAQTSAPSSDIFVPKVGYVGDAPKSTPNGNEPPAAQAAAQNASSKPAGDPTDLRQKGSDDAFVF